MRPFDPPVKAHRVLRQRRVEAAIGGERQRGRVRHVRVQDAGLAAQAMDRGVDEHGGRLDFVPARELAARGVDQHDVGGLDLAPQQASRVQQEAPRTIGQLDAEVVADAFGQAVERGSAQRQREIGTQALDARSGEVPFVFRSRHQAGFCPTTPGRAAGA